MKNRKFKRWQFAQQLASCGYGLRPPVNRLNTRRNRDKLRTKWWNLADIDVRNHFKRLLSKQSAGLSNDTSSATPQAGLEPRKRNGGEQ